MSSVSTSGETKPRYVLSADELSKLATAFYFLYCDKHTFDRHILTNAICIQLWGLCIDPLDMLTSSQESVKIIRKKLKDFWYNHKWTNLMPSQPGCRYTSYDLRFARLFSCRKHSRNIIFRPDILRDLNNL